MNLHDANSRVNPYNANPYTAIELHLQRLAMKKHRPFVPDFSTLQFLQARKRPTHQFYLITFYDTLKQRQFYMRLLLTSDLSLQSWHVKAGAGGSEPHSISTVSSHPVFRVMTLSSFTETLPLVLGGMIAENGFSVISARLRTQTGQILDEDQVENGLVLFLIDQSLTPSRQDVLIDRFSFQVELLDPEGVVLVVQSFFL